MQFNNGKYRYCFNTSLMPLPEDYMLILFVIWLQIIILFLVLAIIIAFFSTKWSVIFGTGLFICCFLRDWIRSFLCLGQKLSLGCRVGTYGGSPAGCPIRPSHLMNHCVKIVCSFKICCLWCDHNNNKYLFLFWGV